jgi:hypothetical protein
VFLIEHGMVFKFQVVIGGGQDAVNVTMTDRRAGKFEAKFYHKVIFLENEKFLVLITIFYVRFKCKGNQRLNLLYNNNKVFNPK